MDSAFKVVKVPPRATKHTALVPRLNRDWAVLAEPSAGEDPKWHVCKHGEQVPVPMFPYLVAATPEAAVGFMLQLGVRLGLSAGGAVEGLMVLIGDDIQQETRGGAQWLRIWAGVALARG